MHPLNQIGSGICPGVPANPIWIALEKDHKSKTAQRKATSCPHPPALSLSSARECQCPATGGGGGAQPVCVWPCHPGSLCSNFGGISKAFRCSAEILYQGSEGSTTRRQFTFCLTHCPSPTLLVYRLILESSPGTGEKWIISYSCHKAGETPHLKNSKWLLGQQYFLFRIWRSGACYTGDHFWKIKSKTWRVYPISFTPKY